ncbi:MAG: acyl-CoA thioesterase [Lachnospiraceae bacterium]|nr:acyl-CoA thioesterase [Lachnospiraceae bacterium]
MYTYKRKAQFHETDRMGIIHHSNYIKWMEEARVGMMDLLGVSYRDMEDKYRIGSPVVSVNVDYKKYVEFGDELEIEVSVKKYNGAILEVCYNIVNRTKDQLAATAWSKHCFLKDGKLVSLKHEIPELDRSFREELKKDTTE